MRPFPWPVFLPTNNTAVVDNLHVFVRQVTGVVLKEFVGGLYSARGLSVTKLPYLAVGIGIDTVDFVLVMLAVRTYVII